MQAVSPTFASPALHSGRWPWITLSISTFVLQLGGLSLKGLFLSPSLLELLCFDYPAISEQQQYWRLLSAHLTHSSFSHLFWDLLAFAAAAAYLERHNPAQLWKTLLLSVLLLDLFLLSPFSTLLRYSGLSGVLYAVLTVAAGRWYQQHRGFIGALPLWLIAGKSLLEVWQQQTLFVSEGWQLFAPAHWVGALAGMLVLLSDWYKQRSSPKAAS